MPVPTNNDHPLSSFESLPSSEISQDPSLQSQSSMDMIANEERRRQQEQQQQQQRQRQQQQNLLQQNQQLQTKPLPSVYETGPPDNQSPSVAGITAQTADIRLANVNRLTPKKGQRKSDQWQCEHCTFLNPPTTKVCEMCDRTSWRKEEEKPPALKLPPTNAKENVSKCSNAK